jgi:hypothetical protein
VSGSDEELGHADAEARQLRVAGQLLPGVDQLGLRPRPVDQDRAIMGVDHPHQRHTGTQVNIDLLVDLLLGVVGREDLHGQRRGPFDQGGVAGLSRSQVRRNDHNNDADHGIRVAPQSAPCFTRQHLAAKLGLLSADW